MKLKKTQTSEMLEALELKVKLELNLILKCKHQVSILNNLPRYLKTLGSSKESAPYLLELQEELEKRNQAHIQSREDAIKWFREKILLFKSSQWAEHPTVKNKIHKADDALQGKYHNLLTGAFRHIWDVFKDAAYAVAAFGYHPLFDDWANLSIYKETVRSNVLDDAPAEVNDDTKWELAEKFNHGFISCKISAYKHFNSALHPWPLNCNEKLNQNGMTYIDLSQGVIMGLSLPQCVNIMLNGNRSQKTWEMDCGSDPATLLAHLQLLAQYPLYKNKTLKPLCLPPKNNPKTLLEVEELFANGCIVYYLSCFDSKDPKQQPASLKELKEFVETFSTMLGSYICKGNIPHSDKKERKPRNDARVRDAEVAKKWMKFEWDQDSKISHSRMADRFRLAFARGEVQLENHYESISQDAEHTFVKWASEADPYPEQIRRSRPKSRNRSST